MNTPTNSPMAQAMTTLTQISEWAIIPMELIQTNLTEFPITDKIYCKCSLDPYKMNWCHLTECLPSYQSPHF